MRPGLLARPGLGPDFHHGLVRPADSGAVMVIVMMVMLGLLGLGVTALWLTGGNLQVGANMNQRTQALYAAEAGIERARAILNAVPAPDITVLLGGSGHALDNIPTRLVNDVPDGVGAVLVDAGSGNARLVDIRFPEDPSKFGRVAPTDPADARSMEMGFYTVWIRNDTAECRMANTGGAADPRWTTDGNSSVVVRSRGVGLDRRTTVILEASLGATPGTPGGPSPPAPPPPELCNSGKNACDDNSSVVSGIVAN